MAKTRRHVRKAPLPARVYFDEQQWPVAIALVVLAGFLMGVSMAYLPLAGVAWHRTAWPSLIAIPLIALAAIVAIQQINSHAFRRSLQLSLVLCAIFHVALVVQMLETRMLAGLFPAKVEREKKEIIEHRQRKIIPEYHPTFLVPDQDRPRQDFQKPVETQSPEPTREPEKIVRQPAEQDRSPQAPQPIPIVEQQRTNEPNVVNRSRPNESAPRLAAQTSQLSRQVKPSAANTSQPVELPAGALAKTAAADLQPTSAAVARQSAESAAAARATSEPSATSSVAASAPARQSLERPPATSNAAQPVTSRTLAKASQAQPSQTAATAPAPKAQKSEPQAGPTKTTPQREAAADSRIARQFAEPAEPNQMAEVSQPSRSMAENADRPAVATKQSQPAARQPSTAPQAATAAAAPATKRSSKAAPNALAEATPAAIQAQRTPTSIADTRPSATVTEASPAAPRNSPATSMARAATPDSPVRTLQPDVAPGETPRRAVAAASQASSAVNLDHPAAAIAQTANAAAQPRRMAVSRAQGGMAGAGHSPNVESSLPGGDSPALVASGALQRAEATQRNPTGDALSPSASSQLARTRSEAEIATAPLLARSLETAGSAGAQQLAEVTASSGAALARSQSAAESGAVNAAKGTAQIDLGPTQRVAESGASRAASGGGQAEISLMTPSPQLARQRLVGGEPQMSLAAAASGEVAAPAGDGGGAPAPEPAPTTALASRASGGSPTDVQSGPASGADAIAAERQGDFSAASLTRAMAARDTSPQASAEEGQQQPNRRLTRVASSESATAAGRMTEEVALPAAGQPGASERAPLAASSASPSRSQMNQSGSYARTNGDSPAGAEIGDTSPGAIASDASPRRESPGAVAGGEPRLASEGASGGQPKRAAQPASPAASTGVAAIPEVGPRSAVAQAEIDHLLSGGGQAPMARRSDDSLVVDVPAAAGPGGLGLDYTPEVGINTRQARADSLNVQLRSARFVRMQLGGVPAVSTSAIVSSEAFSSRGARVLGNSPAGGRGSEEPQTEEAIERGLAFLARYQLPDGGWSLQGFPEGAQLASDTAATALAIIAFQGAGYHHREFQYKDVVRGGLDALLKGQKESGDLFVPLDDSSNRSVWLYSHSLAAIALCEAYGMTQDPKLREPAQKAIDFVVAAQQKERGGWRYSPGVGADTSVSGWMMMALKSGELAGLKVPRETYARIDRWLDDAQQSPSDPHLYRYNPFAPDSPEQRHGRAASKTMTAVGLLMRLYTGWKRDNPHMIRGAAFLGENLPQIGTARAPERDTYYWYYATQVMAHMGADYWQAWIAKLHPLLIDSQVQQGAYAGSWDPAEPIPDRWGPHAGRLYVTALNLLSLEVQYRKLPLYDDTIR